MEEASNQSRLSRGRAALGAGIAGLFAACAIAVPSTGADGPTAQSSACVRATNVEAIVDDSGSMESTDPNRLRVQALDLLVNTLSPGTFLGAVEFGSGFLEQPAADTIFKPEAVGRNAQAMGTALDQKIHADNGATDYNAGFGQSDADNPNANARIFLTDGGHDEGTYNEAHLTHRVPTYVVGFSPGLGSAEDQARLEKIAADTGGVYYPLSDSSQLQSVMNSIGAGITCQTPPQQFTDQLAQGASKAHSVSIGAATKSIQIALTWGSPLDLFKISGLKLVSGGKTVAIAARPHKPRKLKVTTVTSSTFTVLKVSRLSRGKLRFKVTAARIASGVPKATLTTQVSQGSHHPQG